jgi:hypothetical protein
VNISWKMGVATVPLVVASIACGPVSVAPSATAPSQVVSPSPAVVSSSPAGTPTANAIDTSIWKTYESQRYGFSVGYPADWTVDPADHDWTLATDAIWPNEATEHLEGGPEGAQVGVSAWSVAVAPGTSIDTWLSAYCAKNNVLCTRIQDRVGPATMDGHAATLVWFDDELPHAIVLVDGRVYVIACWRPETDASVVRYSGSSRLVEAFVSTMKLLPGGPARSAAPSPS